MLQTNMLPISRSIMSNYFENSNKNTIDFSRAARKTRKARSKKRRKSRTVGRMHGVEKGILGVGEGMQTQEAEADGGQMGVQMDGVEV